MNPAAAKRAAVEAGAQALQRMLALAGRNALARVELAASELDRLESSPAARDRLEVIRAAVEELDGVLHEIERLSNPHRDEPQLAEASLAQTWNAIVRRLSPTFAARDIEVEGLGDADSRWVALPPLVLERILLGFVRLAVVSLDAEGEALAALPLRIAAADRTDGSAHELRLGAARSGQPQRFALAGSDRLELELTLAEWRCELIDETTRVPSRIGLRLPMESGDV